MRMLSAGQPILGKNCAVAHRHVSGILNRPIDRQLMARERLSPAGSLLNVGARAAHCLRD
jgi:hypothetical protein